MMHCELALGRSGSKHITARVSFARGRGELVISARTHTHTIKATSFVFCEVPVDVKDHHHLCQ